MEGGQNGYLIKGFLREFFAVLPTLPIVGWVRWFSINYLNPELTIHLAHHLAHNLPFVNLFLINNSPPHPLGEGGWGVRDQQRTFC
jgi:hypothetical protein